MLKLRRVISSESWVPEIDGLRFVAIMAVLLFHVHGEVATRGLQPYPIQTPLLARLLENGDRGVALFFVISGFVLARPFYHQHRLGGRKVQLPFYFLRRLTRLEPPYLLSLLLYVAALLFMMPISRSQVLRHALASAFYLHNVLYPFAPDPNFVTWSLEIEVQFYILAPLIGQMYRIRQREVRRACWVAATIIGCALSARFSGYPVTLLTYAGYFPAGFLLADLFDDPGRPQKQHWWWDIVGLAGWATIFLLPFSLTTRAFLPLLIVPLYLTAFHGKASRWLFRRPLFTAVGGMCYSLYLLHPLVMAVAFRLVEHVRFAAAGVTVCVQFVLLLAAILLVGGTYFVLVERPCMNREWPNQMLAWFRRQWPSQRTERT